MLGLFAGTPGQKKEDFFNMKNKTKTAKKLLALVLSLMMIVTALPMAILPVSAAGEVTINTTSSTSGVVVIGGNSRWSNSTFNIVNDQEAGNTSAGVISYDISSLRGKKITSAKFTANKYSNYRQIRCKYFWIIIIDR